MLSWDFLGLMDITDEELSVLNTAVSDKGKIIFVMVCGSAAFNLNLPTSDRDLFAVYLANETGPFNKPALSMNSNNPDYCIYGTLVIGNTDVIRGREVR